MDKSEVWYRYEDVAYAVMSNYETESWSSRIVVELREYPVLRRTSKGVWLDVGVRFVGIPSIDTATPKFVLIDARKRFACPTIEEAAESFRARKRRQIRIYEARIRQARIAFAQVESAIH